MRQPRTVEKDNSGDLARMRARRRMKESRTPGRVVRQFTELSERGIIPRSERAGQQGGNYSVCFNGNMNTTRKIKLPECLCGCGWRAGSSRYPTVIDERRVDAS